MPTLQFVTDYIEKKSAEIKELSKVGFSKQQEIHYSAYMVALFEFRSSLEESIKKQLCQKKK